MNKIIRKSNLEKILKKERTNKQGKSLRQYENFKKY